MISDYKNSTSITKIKREEYVIEIRKKKTDHILNKKRIKDSPSHHITNLINVSILMNTVMPFSKQHICRSKVKIA